MNIQKNDILYRPPLSNTAYTNVNGITVKGYDMNKPSDICERRFRVLAVGNCGRLFLDDLRMPGRNIGVCVRLNNIDTYQIIRNEWPPDP